MRISINGKGMEVSDYLRDVIVKRVDKLDKYFGQDTEAKVMLSMLRGRQVVEITVFFGGGLLRAEEATGDIYASLDNACKKLERQIIKHRTRWEKHLKDGALKEMDPLFLTEDETTAVSYTHLDVYKRQPWPRGFFAKTQTSFFSAGIKRDTEKPGTAKKRKNSG